VVQDIYCSIFAQSKNLESEKQPLPGNGCVTHKNGVTVGSDVFCAVHSEAM
jgi:hypothetical protein